MYQVRLHPGALPQKEKYPSKLITLLYTIYCEEEKTRVFIEEWIYQASESETMRSSSAIQNSRTGTVIQIQKPNRESWQL